MAAIAASPATPPSISRSNSAAKANLTSARPHAGSSDLGAVPGSFPRDPHVPLEHLSNKAAVGGTESLTDTGTILDAVQEDFRHAVGVAASYLPESVVGAIGSVIPVGMTNTEEESKSLQSDRTSPSQAGQSSKKVDFKDVAIGGIALDFNPSSTKQTTPVDDSLDTPAATPTPVPRGRSTDLRKKAIEATAVGAGIGTLGGVAYHHNQAQTPEAAAQREPEYAKSVQQATLSPAMQTQSENDNKGKEIVGAAALGGGAGAIGDAALDRSRAHQLPTPPSSPSVTPASQAETQRGNENDENPAFVSYAPAPVITEDTPFPEEDEDESMEKEKGLPPIPAKDAGDDKSNKAVSLGLGAGAVGAVGAATLAQSRAKENNTTPPVAFSEAPPQIPPKAASRPSASGGVGTPTPSTSNDKGKGKDVTSGNGLEGVAVGAGAGALGGAAAHQHQQPTPAVPAKGTPSSGILEPAATPTTGVTSPDPQNKARAGVADPTGTSGSASVDQKDLEKEQQKAFKEAEKREKDARNLEKEAAAAKKKAAKAAKESAKEEKRHEKEMKKEEKRLSKERKEFEKEQTKKDNGKNLEEEKKEDETKALEKKVAAGAAVGGVGAGIGAGIASKQLQKQEEPEKVKIGSEHSGKPKQDDAAQQLYLPSERCSTDANTSATSPEHPSVTSASDVNKRSKQVAAGAGAVGAGAGIGAGVAGDKFDSVEAKKVQESQQQQLDVESNSLAVPSNVHPSIKAACPHPVRPGAVALGAAAPNQRPSSGVDSDFPLPSVNASTEDVPQAVAISGQGRTSFDLDATRQDKEQLTTPVASMQSDRARYHGTEGLQEKYAGGALGSSFIDKKHEEEENVGHRRTRSQGASDRKKEGFVRHLVEKVKDKLHHHEK